MFKNPYYRAFIILYCKQAGTARPPLKQTIWERQVIRMDYELRYVGGHVEVYSLAGVFLFSADTAREAMEELAG